MCMCVSRVRMAIKNYKELRVRCRRSLMWKRFCRSGKQYKTSFVASGMSLLPSIRGRSGLLPFCLINDAAGKQPHQDPVLTFTRPLFSSRIVVFQSPVHARTFNAHFIPHLIRKLVISCDSSRPTKPKCGACFRKLPIAF